MEPTYTIKTTSNMTDLNAHTIRAWERRYKALEPGRHENGRRLYTQTDIERLRLLGSLVNKGHAISSIAPLSSEMLSTMDASSPKLSETEQFPAIRTHSQKPVIEGVSGMVLEHCVKALHSYDLVHINSELEAARLLLSAKDFVTLLAVPLIIRVGELVYEDKLSIAQEHALSAVLRSQMMQILFNARNSLAVRSFTRKDLPQGRVFAVATQEGDLHEFGALAASIIVAVNGHVPHYFGANMPVKALADASNAIHAEIVIVGVTYIPPERRIMSDSDFAQQLELNLRPNTSIWWGGRADLGREFLISHPRQKLLNSLNDLDQILGGTNLPA